MVSVAESSRISVDVIGLRFDTASAAVEIVIHRRAHSPFAGRLALPGVLQLAGERVSDAAARALAKTGIAADAILSRGLLVVFDEPHRDPRGYTLSIAQWAVIAPDSTINNLSQWVPINEVPGLAFDHDRIVRDCRPVLASRLWQNSAFTRGLTGPSFTVSAALRITAALTGAVPDRGNLNRTLAKHPGLTSRPGSARDTGGRPGTVWEWTKPSAPEHV